MARTLSLPRDTPDHIVKAMRKRAMGQMEEQTELDIADNGQSSDDEKDQSSDDEKEAPDGNQESSSRGPTSSFKDFRTPKGGFDSSSSSGDDEDEVPVIGGVARAPRGSGGEGSLPTNRSTPSPMAASVAQVGIRPKAYSRTFDILGADGSKSNSPQAPNQV